MYKLNLPIIFLFSGQGSQYYEMGKTLYTKNSSFRNYFREVDKLYIEISGYSIIEELYFKENKRENEFISLKYTHPSIFMINYSLAMLLIEKGINPHYLLGTSLGEFTALTISGIMSVSTALKCILKQVSFITNKGIKAKMYSLSLSIEKFLLLEIPNIFYEIAAINHKYNFVIVVPKEFIDIMILELDNKNIIYFELKVEYGFHSSLIDNLYENVNQLQKDSFFEEANYPIISSTDGKIRNSIEPSFLWKVLRQPIQFQETIQRIEQESSYIYIDLSPTAMFSSFLKENLHKSSRSITFKTLDLFGNEVQNINKIISTLT